MGDTYITEPERRTPVIEADVFVAGAGTAGCVAAIAAARAGAKVVLVEKMPVPSGTLTNGGIGVYSFHAENNDPAQAVRIVGGIPYEMTQRMERAHGSSGFMPTPNDTHRSPYKVIFNHEVVKGVLCEMLMEAGVTVYLQTMFCGVQMEGNTIKAAFIENKNGRTAVAAKQYIDCTGDADVAKFAGVELVENWQDYDTVCGGPTGLVFGMAGIDFDKALTEGKNMFIKHASNVSPEVGEEMNNYMLVTVKEPERCKPINDLGMNYFTIIYSLHPGEATYINNSKGVKVDASNADDLSRAEMEMRVKIMKLAGAMKECVPGFEDSYMSWASMQLGIRSSKIAVCDKMITQEDISAGARFEDEIGLYGFHDLSPKREHCFINHDGFYGFPYRMLLPKGCDNLFMAGRNVTEDIEAHMSTRNTVGSMLMGQGAGVAAALCAADGLDSRSLPYGRLREELLAQDVILDV